MSIIVRIRPFSHIRSRIAVVLNSPLTSPTRDLFSVQVYTT